MWRGRRASLRRRGRSTRPRRCRGVARSSVRRASATSSPASPRTSRISRRRPRRCSAPTTLVGQLRAGDELIVVDNASTDGTVGAVRELAAEAVVVETGGNLGFAAACNRGAEAATGELLCFLNPDAVVQPGWREAIEAPLHDGRRWAAWQALVTAEGGRVINTRGGVAHFTGIAWAGGAGGPTGPDQGSG